MVVEAGRLRAPIINFKGVDVMTSAVTSLISTDEMVAKESGPTLWAHVLILLTWHLEGLGMTF